MCDSIDGQRAGSAPFLLKEPLDAICSASIVYLTMDNNTLGAYNDVKDLAEQARKSSEDFTTERCVQELISQDVEGFCSPLAMENGYKSIVGLKKMKALKKAKELVIDNAQEEIEQNLRALQSKLGASQESNSDASLYSALKKGLDNIDPLSLKWKDPLASMVLSNDSTLVENLKPRQKRTFLAPGENMKCDIPASVNNKCEHFINNFNMLEVSDEIRGVTHNLSWVENENKLEKRVEHIY
ncbi:34787_t:CDS:2 [Racocetra persica]|uniref:34787_t:CDS:1 n=1 Tax=Racocetra persica TaxID=160502 RepID=A0ACA9KTI2_9GLOM|nr:34787_t:CDS:2 [Racocetra persica]